MKKTLLWPFALLFAATVIVTACNHLQDDTNQVTAPATATHLERTFQFLTSGAEEKQTYQGDKLLAGFVQDEDVVYITFTTGKDNLFLELDRADLKEGLAGSYTLKSLPSPDAGIARVTYSYSRGNNSSTLLFSSANIIEGALVISKYDAKNQLISGSYFIDVKDAHDPTKNYHNLAEAPKCHVALKGQFENLTFVSL